jgi:hypothetical protein
MPGLPPTVSGRHLEILPFKNKLLLRHVGSNPTLVEQSGAWFQLRETWISEQSLVQGLNVYLADVQLVVSLA